MLIILLCNSYFFPTLTDTVPATMPSTVDSAKGSKCLSKRRMKSGFRMYPERPLYSKIPRFSCIARSENRNMLYHYRRVILAIKTKSPKNFCLKQYFHVEVFKTRCQINRRSWSLALISLKRNDTFHSCLPHIMTIKK